MFDAPQISNLGTYRREMGVCDDLHFAAGLRPTVDQREQIANLFEREPRFPRTHDETQASDLAFVICPVELRRSWRLWHDADVLVVSDGLNVASSQPGQIRAANNFH